MPAIVKQIHVHGADRQDSVAAGEARFGLKIASLAYFEARIGADATPQVAAQARVELAVAAVVYYGRVMERRPVIDPRRLLEREQEMSRLQLMGLAYASTRHGADACPELSRHALGRLCEAAVLLCESVGDAGDRGPAGARDATVADDGDRRLGG